MKRQNKKVLARYCGGFLIAGLLLFCGACTGIAPLSDSSLVEQKDKKQPSQSMLILPNSIGTHFGGTSGVNVFLTDDASGLLHPSEGNPFGSLATSLTLMIAATADGKYLYAANPYSDAEIAGFAIDGPSGALKDIVGSPFFGGNRGGWNAWIAIDPSARFLYRVEEGYATHTDYLNIMKYRIDPETGALGWTGDLIYTSGAAGSMTFDPQGRFLFLAANLKDEITTYSVDPQSGTLKFNSAVATGSYPHSLTVLGKFLYVPTRGGIYAYRIEEQGQLALVTGSPFYPGESFSEIAVSPRGGHLFTISGLSRRLSSLVVDSNSGELLETTGSPLFLNDSSFALAVAPDSERLYVQTCTGFQTKPVTSKILAYSIDQMTGSLTFERETQTPQDSCADSMLAIQR
jgi:6-phosphogluconolactonase (cycloisomerase 2 family)